MKLKLLHYLAMAITVTSFLSLSGCSQKEKANTVSVGTISGPETDLMTIAQTVAKERYGLNVKIVTFTDYVMPNEALNDGSIDANFFQHVPYLNAQSKQRGYQFVVIGKGFLYPIGIYAQKVKSLNDLPKNGKIAVPNDPSNEARALLLLEKAGVITLRANAGENAMPSDITANPKHISIIELDAAQLPRSLSDVDAAVITNTYAVAAGLKLSDAIYKEGADSFYVNVLVARQADANSLKIKELLEAFQSQAVIDKAKQLFGDGAIPAFNPTAAPVA